MFFEKKEKEKMLNRNHVLIRTKHMQLVKNGDIFVIYHSLFGYPQVVNEEAIRFLQSFSSPQKVSTLMASFNVSEEELKVFTDHYFLIPPDFSERDFLQKRLEVYLPAIRSGGKIEYLSLIASELCNFSCTYCMSSSMINASHRNEQSVKLMSVETAKSTVDIFLRFLKQNGKTNAYINFGGGEPLLNWRLIKEVIKYCHKRYSKEFEFRFRINTNGSLFNHDKIKFLKDNNVQVAISLDGLRQANDKVRKTRRGNKTFDRIVSAMDAFSEHGFSLGGFSSTITQDNFADINEELLEFAVSKGFVDLRLDLDVIHMLDIAVEEAAEKLLALKRKAGSYGISLSGFWERPAENLNDSILDRQIAFCGGLAGHSMCVSPSGQIYICGYSANLIGQIGPKNSFFTNGNYEKIITSRFAGQIERCIGCSIEGQCLGGCYISEEFSQLGDDPALQYNCHLYRLMTKELLKDSIKDVEKQIIPAERR